MTEIDVRNSITQAMAEPKAPPELVEKGLKMARMFEKVLQEQKNQKVKEAPHTDNPFIGGSNLSL